MMPILSIIFCVVGYLSIGYLLFTWLKQDNRGVGNSFLVGSGATSLLTLILALLFKENLRLVSLALLTAGILCFSLYLLTGGGQKAKNLRSLFIDFFPIILLVFLLLPIMIGSYNVRVWGDEVPSWTAHVKEMIFYNDLLPPPEKAMAAVLKYPPLWKIINVNALAIFNRIHEGAGRIISILFILGGSLFIFEELRKTWNISTAKSTVWAAVMLALICGSEFPYTASWYSDPSFSIFLMAATYYTILGLSMTSAIEFGKVGIGSLFLTICVGMRPDGIFFLPLFVLIAVYLLILLKSETWQMKVLALLLIILPSFILFAFWQTYASLLGFASTYNLDVTVRKFIDIEGLLRLIPLATKAAVAKLDFLKCIVLLFPQYIPLFICILIMLVSRRRRTLIQSEWRVLLLLLLFPIYNTLIGFALMLAYFSEGHVVVPTRYLTHSAPIVYFVLGVLLLRLYQSKNIPIIIGRMIGVVMLFLVLLNSITLGGVYSHLSHDINDYMEHVSQVVKSNYPEFCNVQFIAQKGPYNNACDFWRYYALPELYTRLPHSIGKSEGIDLSIVHRDTSIQTNKQYMDLLRDNNIQLVVVYESDNEFNRLSGLGLQQDNVYLLGLNEKKDGFSILWSEKRPPIDAGRRHQLRNAGKGLWEDIRNGKWKNIL